jgi:serine/threonine protein phosphatase PrpC
MTKHQQYQRAKMIISKAEEMNPTRRDTMEDCILTHSPGSWGCNDSQMSFLAVIDGHGGRDIVVRNI